MRVENFKYGIGIAGVWTRTVWLGSCQPAGISAGRKPQITECRCSVRAGHNGPAGCIATQLMARAASATVCRSHNLGTCIFRRYVGRRINRPLVLVAARWRGSSGSRLPSPSYKNDRAAAGLLRNTVPLSCNPPASRAKFPDPLIITLATFVW